MAEPEDVPGPHAEFEALTRAELADVAEAGRRIERAHRMSPRPRGRRHLRIVRSDERPARRSRVPLAVQYLIALLVVAAVIAVSLAFATRHDPVSSGPVVRPDVVVPIERLFPDQFTGVDSNAYQLLTTSESTTCGVGEGVPQELVATVGQAGGCDRIQLALYTDTGRRMLVTVGVITMQTVAEMQVVNDAILHSGGAMMVSMLRPPASAHVAVSRAVHGTTRPAFVTPTGSAVVVGVGDATATGPGDPEVLRQGVTAVMDAVTRALVAGQPTATLTESVR